MNRTTHGVTLRYVSNGHWRTKPKFNLTFHFIWNKWYGWIFIIEDSSGTTILHAMELTGSDSPYRNTLKESVQLAIEYLPVLILTPSRDGYYPKIIVGLKFRR